MKRQSLFGIALTLLLVSISILLFNIQPVRAIETIRIGADGSIDPPTAPINRDGDLYTLTSNIISDANGIVIERSNMTLDGEGHTLQGFGIWFSNGISLTGRSNVTITDLTIKEFTAGIQLDSASNNNVCGNNVIDNWYGITLKHSSNNNNIHGNNVTNNKWWGINLYESSNNNIILRNNVTDNEEDGISLDMSSSNNSICGNTLASNGYGIRLGYSPDNNISENNVAGNEYGVYIRQSSNNLFHHNNFIDNLCQVCRYASEPGETPPINVWDDGYPSGGNYWSDYSGVDSNSDGIGDAPYTIDASNQDQYPLKNPWIERKVGVKVGDWAKYDVGVSWTGVLHQMFSAISETKWLTIEATDISDTEVTFTGTLHFKNDTEQVTTGGKWDITPTGSYGIVLFFIGSNLKQHDKIYPISTYTINETVTRTYNGVPRENNHLNVSTSYVLTPPAVYDIYRLDCYWDKAIGILTEETLEMTQDDLSRSLSIHVKMADTNLWEAPVPTTIGELKTEIDELDSESEIDNQGIGKSLVAKLNAAQKLMDKEKTDEATVVLEGFIMQVQELSGIHITAEAADILIQSAEYILSQL